MITKPSVIEKWQKKNKFGRPGTPLTAKKIAIHYTGKADVEGWRTVSYFNNVVANGYKVNGKYIYASSHYVIDLDGTIYQLIPTSEICYATNSANSYAIAIEVATTGPDNHYTDKTYKSMVHLCTWLCQYKGLDCKKDIITHTDVVGKAYKLCPIYMVKNPDKMAQFKLDCWNLKAGKITIDNIVNCTAPHKTTTDSTNDSNTNNTTNTNTVDNANTNTVGNANNTSNTKTNTTIPKLIKVIQHVNFHNAPDFKSSSVVGVAKVGEVFTVVDIVFRSDTNMYKLKSGYYITASTKYVQKYR